VADTRNKTEMTPGGSFTLSVAQSGFPQSRIQLSLGCEARFQRSDEHHPTGLTTVSFHAVAVATPISALALVQSE
jgi:hypothetical protein